MVKNLIFHSEIGAKTLENILFKNTKKCWEKGHDLYEGERPCWYGANIFSSLRIML